MDSMQFRTASASDATALSAFAARTFAETFGSDNSPEDMAAYINSTFTPENQASEIADPGGIVLLATSGENAGREMIGYAYLAGATPPPEVAGFGSDPIELKRFYIASAWHGHGVAQELMKHVFRAARQLGAQTLWLGVWERNQRAIAFYRKIGFHPVGTQSFQLGGDTQTDWIMVCQLARSAD